MKNEIKEIVDRAVIRKDPFNGVAKQWQADLYFNDGKVWYSWCSGYRSKKSLIDSINYVHEDILIVRAPYKESWDTAGSIRWTPFGCNAKTIKPL
jgi:hypothetical protein